VEPNTEGQAQPMMSRQRVLDVIWLCSEHKLTSSIWWHACIVNRGSQCGARQKELQKVMSIMP